MFKKYTYTARSLNDPNGDKGGLGFDTRYEAYKHTLLMNNLIKTYPENWNTDFWITQPLEWKIFRNGV